MGRTKSMAGTAPGVRVAAQMIIDKESASSTERQLARLVVDLANQIEEQTPKSVKRPPAKAPRRLLEVPSTAKVKPSVIETELEAENSKLGIGHTCQSCCKRKNSTRDREIYLSNYSGRCGDSFCAGSCDSSSCFPVRYTVCDDCYNKLKKKGT